MSLRNSGFSTTTVSSSLEIGAEETVGDGRVWVASKCWSKGWITAGPFWVLEVGWSSSTTAEPAGRTTTRSSMS